MKQFDCVLEKMPSYGSKYDENDLTCDPDRGIIVWTKRIKAGGIMKAIKKLDSQHKKMSILENNIDKLNPNHYRCSVSIESNYWNDITGFDLDGYGENARVIVGMVFIDIYEVRIDEDENETRNYGYENDGDWY